MVLICYANHYYVNLLVKILKKHNHYHGFNKRKRKEKKNWSLPDSIIYLDDNPPSPPYPFYRHFRSELGTERLPGHHDPVRGHIVRGVRLDRRLAVQEPLLHGRSLQLDHDDLHPPRQAGLQDRCPGWAGLASRTGCPPFSRVRLMAGLGNLLISEKPWNHIDFRLIKIKRRNGVTTKNKLIGNNCTQAIHG